MGYHTRQIAKGEIGEFSKIEEEWEELQDARAQAAPVLEIVELTDLLGAIEAYVTKRYNLNMRDLLQMTEMTRSAFREGKR